MSAMDGATFSADLWAYLSERVPQAAREAARRFPLIDQGDFEQECWLRACISVEPFERDIAEHPEFIWRKLRDVCHRYGVADDRDRRARKAAVAGYLPRDEFYYNPQMLGVIITALVEADWDLPSAMDRATKGVESGMRVSGGGDEHDGFMEYLTLLTDVREAYLRLTRAQRDILVTWYREGADDADDQQLKWSREAIAASMTLTYNALELRKRRALAALLHELGGENPYR